MSEILNPRASWITVTRETNTQNGYWRLSDWDITFWEDLPDTNIEIRAYKNGQPAYHSFCIITNGGTSRQELTRKSVFGQPDQAGTDFKKTMDSAFTPPAVGAYTVQMEGHSDSVGKMGLPRINGFPQHIKELLVFEWSNGSDAYAFASVGMKARFCLVALPVGNRPVESTNVSACWSKRRQ